MLGTATRVLVVEDDHRIRRLLHIALRHEGYRVTEASDGTSALEALEAHGFDVIILDLMLPDLDGFEVCRLLRRRSDVPVIIVSAKGDSHDIVAGLGAGADDYIVKPVVAKELSARIRALLRRSTSTSPDGGNARSGNIEIRPREGTVLRDGRPVPLTTTELRLLEELAEHLGEIVSREALLERVWGYDHMGDSRLVDAHISRLRSKIEDDPGHPRHVVTARGLGYKLAP